MYCGYIIDVLVFHFSVCIFYIILKYIKNCFIQFCFSLDCSWKNIMVKVSSIIKDMYGLNFEAFKYFN